MPIKAPNAISVPRFRPTVKRSTKKPPTEYVTPRANPTQDPTIRPRTPQDSGERTILCLHISSHSSRPAQCLVKRKPVPPIIRRNGPFLVASSHSSLVVFSSNPFNEKEDREGCDQERQGEGNWFQVISLQQEPVLPYATRHSRDDSGLVSVLKATRPL